MEYVLVRSKRSGILMKALPGGEIRIWAPARMGLKVIDDVVREHMDELEGMQERLEKTLENNRLLHPVEEGSRICIEGKAYDLHRVKLGRTSLRIADGVCTLSLSSPDDQEAVRAA